MSFYPISTGGTGSGLNPVYIDNTDSPYPAITGSVISADTTTAAITINLPPSGSDAVIFIKDYKYNASTFNITITPNGADTINSQSSLVLDTNGAYLGLSIAAGQTDWDAFVLSDNTDAVAFNNRNRFINGDFAIDQRNSGAAQTIIASDPKSYTVDGWYAYCLGASVTGQQVAGSLQSQYRYRFSGAASNTSIQFGQRITSNDSYDLNGQTCTISVDLANNILTEVNWSAYYANTTNAFGTIASPTRTLIDSGTFTGVSSTVARYSAQITVPSAATTGIEVVFSVTNQTSGTWTIGDAQLEMGSVATDFEKIHESINYLKCRTRTKVFLGDDINFNGYAINATTATAIFDFSPPFIANPSFGDIGSNYVVQYLAAVSSVTGFTPITLTKERSKIEFTTTGLTAGDGIIFRNGSATTSKLLFEAEL